MIVSEMHFNGKSSLWNAVLFNSQYYLQVQASHSNDRNTAAAEPCNTSNTTSSGAAPRSLRDVDSRLEQQLLLIRQPIAPVQPTPPLGFRYTTHPSSVPPPPPSPPPTHPTPPPGSPHQLQHNAPSLHPYPSLKVL